MKPMCRPNMQTQSDEMVGIFEESNLSILGHGDSEVG